MVYEIDVPVQPLATGVTVIVATTVEVVALVAVKVGILPAPLAANPMEGSLLVQLKVVPGTDPVGTTWFTVAPLQTTMGGIGSTVGIGLTVTL